MKSMLFAAALTIVALAGITSAIAQQRCTTQCYTTGGSIYNGSGGTQTCVTTCL